MTEAELLEALHSAQAPFAGEGVTVQELSAATGRGVLPLRKQLKTAIAAGKIRPSRKVVVDISGRSTTVPSYITC